MTGRDLVTASLRLIGAIAPGESIAAQEATDGLASINRMISSWSIERLMIYATVIESFTLTPNDQTYTMGPSGDFVTTRPITIDQVVLKNTSSSPAIEYELNILSQDQWASIPLKQVGSNLPTDCFLEGTHPNETIHLYPVPKAAYDLVFYSTKPLSSITDLDSVISLPEGYERAIIFNGAVELTAEYGMSPSPHVLGIASESKASIKRANFKPSYLKADEAIVQDGRFNILTGGYGR